MIKRIINFFHRTTSEPREPTIAERSADAEKAYRQWMREKQINVNLTRIYTQTDGRNWYMLSDPLHIIEERAQMLDDALIAAKWNLTVADAGEMLLSYPSKFETIKKLINDKQYQLAAQICTDEHNNALDANWRLKNISSEDAILTIASIFFYIDDENPSTVEDVFIKRKREMLESDLNARAFFLKITFDTFKISATVNADDFLKSLRKAKTIPHRKHQSTTNAK